MEGKLKKSLTLFWTFFKIGAFTFGGGYAMIPLITKEVVDNKKWITDKDILDVFAIAESTPGPIAVNSATFIGSKIAGFWGAFFATLGVVLPSFAIISLISFVIDRFQHLQIVEFAFAGIRAGVLALIIKALVSMYKQCPKDLVSYIITGLAFVAVCIFDINVLIVLISCAIIGLVSSIVAVRREKK